MIILIVALVVVVDQLIKYWALTTLKPIGDIPLLPNWFHLTYVENRGAAFGLFQNQRLFFFVMTFLILGVLIFFLMKNKNAPKLVKVSIAMIMGGAIGNLIDRIRLGFVVDYLHLYQRFPVFNVADSAVVVGAILFSYCILRYDVLESKEL